MDRQLSGSEIDDLAHERASRYAPRPAHDPTYAGIVGAAVTGMTLAVFTGFAGMVDKFPLATVVTLGLGFLLPFAYFKNQERLHYSAWEQEYRALEQRRQSPDTLQAPIIPPS